MAHPRYIRWLYEELPELVAKGVLTQTQVAQLREYYGKVAEKPAVNVGLLVAGTLGALLVGSGILLIFAYNWEDLSKTWRTILSFIPLMIAQCFYAYAFLYRHRFAAWTEATSAFLMLMVAACIALISQTYHLWGEPEHFLRNWMLLSIPLIYLLNSSLVTIIYLVGIASWTLQVDGSDSVWYWGLLSATVPHLIYNWRKRTQALRRDALGWALPVTFIFGWFGTVEANMATYSLIGTMVWISGFYLLGLWLFPGRNQSFMSRPLQTFSVICGFIYLLLLSGDYLRFANFDLNKIIFGEFYTTWAGITNFSVLLLLIGGYLYLLLRDIQERPAVDHFATLLPVFGSFVLLLNLLKLQTVGLLMANAYLLAWGIFYLLSGIRRRRMAWVNIGMFFILALMTVRFFDTQWSMLLKGIIFVLLGVGFLVANIILPKRLNSNADTF